MSTKRQSGGRILLCLCAALICASLAVFFSERVGVGDSDYYWQITLGKYICENRAIPREDVFSWLSPELGLKETAHSWLGSVILYGFSILFSNPLYGLYLYIGCTVAIYALFVELFWGRKIRDPFMNILFTGAVTVPLAWAGRPQNFGMLFFMIGFYLLVDAYTNPRSKLCWFLPVLSVLWANIHGGSLPFLFAFNALFIVLCFFPDCNAFGLYNERGYWKPRCKRLCALLTASVGAGLINPYGISLYWYFCVTNNSATKRYVSEWQGAGLNDQVVFFCLVLLFIAFASKKKVQLYEFAPVIACMFLTAAYVRIRSYWLIVTTPIAFRLLETMLLEQKNWMWQHTEVVEKPFSGATRNWTILLSACFLGACCIYAPIVANDPDKTTDKMSESFVEQLRELNPQRMYTSYNEGGIAIYHEFKSFADSRADLFPEDVLNASIQLSGCAAEGERGMQDMIERYDFDAILLNRKDSSSAIEFLDVLPGWERVVEDDYYIVFAQS